MLAESIGRRWIISVTCLLFLWAAKSQEMIPAEKGIIPAPKEAAFRNGKLCFHDTLYFYSKHPELNKLYDVLKEELLTLTGTILKKTTNKKKSSITAVIDNSLANEAYKIDVGNHIKISGSSYNAVAMASATLLQSLAIDNKNICWQKGYINDHPDFHYRGLLIDLARRKHDIETIKRVIMLCRWYKINYLQLHLTDEYYFTFPSTAYPQLSTKGWSYTEEQLADLISFADARGVQIIPELEIPGHAGQFIQKMPEVFGFSNQNLNRFTINMGRDRVYSVLDTLIGEVARIFHTSDYIHIAGDEANFEGMENDPDVAVYLQQHGLRNMQELYWHFLNRIHASVKKRGKKTIVWEGFSKEGNKVVDKDIIVMAWETMYQLPQDILAAGYTTINVSWKPLYVVNERKWSPREIFSWHIYRWENWVPSIPSYTPIQLPAHPNLIGASMASWDQPAYTEISSLRKRLPAMVEETWNHSQKPALAAFLRTLEKLDKKFSHYLSPVTIIVEGLTYPDVKDGTKDEQTFFDDILLIKLSVPAHTVVRYTLDGSAVKSTSPVFKTSIELTKTAELRYRAYQKHHPVGAEMLAYYELHPLKVNMSRSFIIQPDSWIIGFHDSVKINFASTRKGVIKYVTGDKELDHHASLYASPITIKDTTVVKAGLFVNDSLVGKPWIQNFRKE